MSANAGMRFSHDNFRDLIDWSEDTITVYGAAQVKASFLKLAASAPDSVTAGATAFAGGGQSSATLISRDITNVTTVATAGDSLKLPTAAAGLIYTVANNGANALALFPNTGDTINGGSANASITIPVGAVVSFSAINATDWKTNAQRVFTAPISKTTATAVNTTATVTAPQVAGGLFTSTSAAAVGLTLPSATAIAAQIGAVQGTTFDFLVDNSAGANTVTVIVGSGIAVATPAITGGATLTVSTANVVGQFRLLFTSGTAAVLSRIV